MCNDQFCLFPLTSLVDAASGPGLGKVKVRVSTDAVSREVCVSQEAALAVERCTVAVETVGKGQHDVCVAVWLCFDLAVGNLPEGERDHALPHLEGFLDGFKCGSLADLGGVVLYTATTKKSPQRVKGQVTSWEGSREVCSDVRLLSSMSKSIFIFFQL